MIGCLIGLHDWYYSYPDPYECCRNCGAERERPSPKRLVGKKVKNMWGKPLDK